MTLRDRAWRRGGPRLCLLARLLLVALPPGKALAQPLPLPPPVPPGTVPAPPPLLAPPLPGVGQVLPPLKQPDPALEAAMRERLFAGPLEPVPGKGPDPDGTEWQQARAQRERPRCGEVGEMRYLHTLVDLDGDGQPEALAAVVGSFVCGSRGCTLFVFRRGPAGLVVVNELDLFESPLLIDGQRRNGWQNLTMPAALSLGGPPGALVQLQFDGRQYARSPMAPTLPRAGAATVVLQLDPVPFEQLGLPLPCAP